MDVQGARRTVLAAHDDSDDGSGCHDRSLTRKRSASLPGLIICPQRDSAVVAIVPTLRAHQPLVARDYTPRDRAELIMRRAPNLFAEATAARAGVLLTATISFMSSMAASGRRLIVAMLVLFVCDVIGGFIGVSEGVNTWGEAWGFNAESTVPLPVAAAQVVLAWLAARNVRPPIGLIAAVLLSAFCLISLMFGLFDGDFTSAVASAGWGSWGVVWGVVLLSVTAVVGLLAAARARQLFRLRRRAAGTGAGI